MAKSFPQPWQCDLGYIQLSGLQIGTGAKCVIALHGFLDNANSMIGLASAFEDSHFIAIDLAGHGQSGHRPAGSHYNQLDFIQDIHELIKSLNVERVTLVGHSLGGILATLYASIYPEHVISIVSIDALGPLAKSEDTTQQQIRDAIDSRSSKMIESPPRRVEIDSAVQARARLTDLSEDLCRFILERNIKADPVLGQVWSSDSRLRTKSWLRMTSGQAKQLMENILCPVLVIGASKSFKLLSEAYEQRKDWFDRLSFQLLEGGHHIHLEQLEKTCELIVQFLSGLED